MAKNPVVLDFRGNLPDQVEALGAKQARFHRKSVPLEFTIEIDVACIHPLQLQVLPITTMIIRQFAPRQGTSLLSYPSPSI